MNIFHLFPLLLDVKNVTLSDCNSSESEAMIAGSSKSLNFTFIFQENFHLPHFRRFSFFTCNFLSDIFRSPANSHADIVIQFGLKTIFCTTSSRVSPHSLALIWLSETRNGQILEDLKLKRKSEVWSQSLDRRWEDLCVLKYNFM